MSLNPGDLVISRDAAPGRPASFNLGPLPMGNFTSRGIRTVRGGEVFVIIALRAPYGHRHTSYYYELMSTDGVLIYCSTLEFTEWFKKVQ